jgi:hypothetical protein
MARGVQVGIHLQPGLPDENSIATALGNESLQWQVLRVETSPGQYHFRLIIRHPERVLDLGIQKALARLLEDLSDETPDQLAKRFEEAKSKGLTPVPLRPIEEPVDYWRDDFWNWIG